MIASQAPNTETNYNTYFTNGVDYRKMVGICDPYDVSFKEGIYFQHTFIIIKNKSMEP